MVKPKTKLNKVNNSTGGTLLLNGTDFPYVDVIRRNAGTRTEFLFFNHEQQVTLIYEKFIDTIDRMFPPAIIQRRLLGLNPTPQDPQPPFKDELGFNLYLLGPVSLTDSDARLRLKLLHLKDSKKQKKVRAPKLTYDKKSSSAVWWSDKRVKPVTFSFSEKQNKSFEIFYEHWRRGDAPLRGSKEAIEGTRESRFSDVWSPSNGKNRRMHDAITLGLIIPVKRGLYALNPGYDYDE